MTKTPEQPNRTSKDPTVPSERNQPESGSSPEKATHRSLIADATAPGGFSNEPFSLASLARGSSSWLSHLAPTQATPVIGWSDLRYGGTLRDLMNPLTSSVALGTTALDSELAEIKEEVRKRGLELASKDHALKKHAREIEQLEAKLTRATAIQRIQHLLNRVSEIGKQTILKDPAFLSQFAGAHENTYVVSIDVRRSTELMLKARQPDLFAQFLLGLAMRLREQVVEHFGVFDKFTGDGVLAFFPPFYSGPQAGLWAVRAALGCHEVFASWYREHRSSFTAVLRDVGLGIGIDHGDVHMVEIGAELTVVGTPVVYACRMAGTPAGTTLANQSAYEHIFQQHGEFCDFREVEIQVKHEGALVGYEVTGSGKPLEPAAPEWALDAVKANMDATIPPREGQPASKQKT